MILNQVQPEDYKDVDWEYKAEENEVLVIHTLCYIQKMFMKSKENLGLVI